MVGQEEALKILMSQAESSSGSTAATQITLQKWQVNTPIDFRGWLSLGDANGYQN